MNRNFVSTLKFFSLSLFGIIIVGYALFQAKNIISGPVIDVYTPQNGATYQNPLIEVTGKATRASFINLNGRKIFTDKQGYFKEQLLLSPGYTILVLDARDSFGKTTTKKLELILKEY